MQAPQQQTRRQNGNGQSTLERTINNGLEAANSALETLRKVDKPFDYAQKIVDVGKLILSGGNTVTKLDAAINDLENAGPGTVDTIKEIGKTLSEASKLIDPTYVPSGLKEVHKDLVDATKEFQELSASYDKYEKTKDLSSFNPFNWGKKASAAKEVVKEWGEFKKSWEQLETHVPSNIKDTAEKAAQGVLQGISDILKSL